MKRNILKRYRMGTLCLLLVLTTVLGLSIPARAASKYMECRNADFTVVLDETGGATVTETWECYFGGDTISRYRRSYMNPEPDCYSIQVLSVELDGSSLELLDAPDDSRPEGCAAVFYDSDGSMHIEMYLRAYEELRTFTFTYYVTNAVILYNDVAEFHFDLTGENESFDIDSLEAYVEIPYGTRDRGLAFWAHTPSKDATFDALTEDGMVNRFVLNSDNIPADRAVTIRFAMPLELFPDGSRFRFEDGLDAILEEEHARMDIGNEPDGWSEPTEPYEDPYVDPVVEEPASFWENAQFMLSLVFAIFMGFWSVVALVLCLLPFVLLIFSSLIKRYVSRVKVPKICAANRLKPAMAPDYYRTLPDRLKPALVYKLMSVYPFRGEGQDTAQKGNAFSATILDLMESGRIIAGRGLDGQLVYQLDANASAPPLTDFEQVVIDLFSIAGAASRPMTTQEITDYMRNNYTWCKGQYRIFKTSLEDAFQQSQLSRILPGRKVASSRKIAIQVICGVLIFIGAGYPLGFLTGLALGVLMGIFSGGSIFLLWDELHPDVPLLTQDGENHYALWKAYSNFLRDFTTFEDKDLGDLKIWRKHLVYATALGCSQNVIDNLKISMPEIYDSFISDPYLRDYEDVFRSISDIDQEAGYTIHSGGSSGGGWSSSDSDWGGCSDSGGGSDSGSSGSDFD